MLRQSICRYIFILAFSLSLVSVGPRVWAQADTVAVADTMTEVKGKQTDSTSHQLNIGVDIFHPIVNHYLIDRSAYELEADYYLRKEFYAAIEFGWGGSKVNYPDLRYTTTNSFLRLGFNKAIFSRDNPRDWDMMMFGLRLGVANIQRSSAAFSVADSVWGNTPDSTLARRPAFIAAWAELTLGMRVQVTGPLYAGWNLRGKFMMNGKSFKDLSPLYIAGYGRGDKNSAFDFNVYLSYAVRWKRKVMVR
jgi:hypothetical protein